MQRHLVPPSATPPTGRRSGLLGPALAGRPLGLRLMLAGAALGGLGLMHQAQSQTSAGPASPATPVTAAPSASSAAEAGAPAPAYATRPPPAATLRYGLRSGMLSGRGSLRWQFDAVAGYTLSLEGTVLGFSALSQGSRGALGRQGLSPDHFSDARRGRPEKTVQFDPAAGQIRFSAGAPALAWRPRVQDRLSWMLQLSAVAAANPALMQPGAPAIDLFVVGARGRADLWSFQVVGVGDIRLPEGRVSGAVHLRRQSRQGSDTQVDVWLDPARHHLPVSIRLADDEGGRAFELQLEGYAQP